ncbi:hypothetical protein Golax_008715 [Gossypium laxum]|uniref:Inositol-tetrakisphosphate 1-kinase n=1 Tax=Gossypium laxum TaxID=34288 RepID=A0A7J9AAQ4_9ROSI|nr:hypothetical protein [Gossypium laxum]
MSQCSIEVLPPQQQRNDVVVGYALTSKKVKELFTTQAPRNKGISFVPIDQSRPLSDQGPFDIVLHKMTGREWRQILEVGLGSRSYSFCFLLGMMEYRQTHPKVLVLDPPDAIQHLHNRQSMLQYVADMNLLESSGKVGVLRQLVIKRDTSSIPDFVAEAGLRLPLVAKPFVNDGSEKSHELSLAYDQYSLQKLEPPLVLQEFVNHGGVLFKVFIVGEAIKVVRRFSLPDVTIRELSTNVGVYEFPRVSCAAACADDADLDPSVAELPPWPLLERLAKELQQRLEQHKMIQVTLGDHGGKKMLKRWQNVATPKQTSDDGKIVQFKAVMKSENTKFCGIRMGSAI